MTMSELNAERLIELLKKSFVKENAAGVNTCVQFNLAGANGGNWFMKIKNQAIEVQNGSTDDANAEINIKTNDFLGIITGELDPLKAFFTGKIKIIGDQSAVMKLVSLFRVNEDDLKQLQQ
mgnify:CR=1 FL=1